VTVCAHAEMLCRHRSFYKRRDDGRPAVVF
jgi:hypothetical protein